LNSSIITLLTKKLVPDSSSMSLKSPTSVYPIN
jgi:hypothetical protein